MMGTKFMVVTDNVANTFFTTQKKLTIKQAKWQKFLANFNFLWVHRVGRHNQVADALNRKEVMQFMGSLSRVIADFTTRVKQKAPHDFAYNKLVGQVKESTTRYYWLEKRIAILSGYEAICSFQQIKMRVAKGNARWASHLGEDRTFALISQSFH